MWVDRGSLGRPIAQVCEEDDQDDEQGPICVKRLQNLRIRKRDE